MYNIYIYIIVIPNLKVIVGCTLILKLLSGLTNFAECKFSAAYWDLSKVSKVNTSTTHYIYI
jgi:hypothetical protein